MGAGGAARLAAAWRISSTKIVLGAISGISGLYGSSSRGGWWLSSGIGLLKDDHHSFYCKPIVSFGLLAGYWPKKALGCIILALIASLYEGLPP
jgi:hypothetical protein